MLKSDLFYGSDKTGNDKKQDAPVIKPPLNAVPFSDEWLAAFEAAGEVILLLLLLFVLFHKAED